MQKSLHSTTAALVGLLILISGLCVLGSWLLHLDLPAGANWIVMKANTAFAFILAGTVLLIKANEERIPPDYAAYVRTGTQIGALLILLVGCSSLFEYLLGIDLGIDQLLADENPGAVATSHPGRMAPSTALCFIFSGASLLFSGFRRYSYAQVLSLLSGMIALLVVVGAIYEAQLFAHFTRMALHTALLFLALSLGILCLGPGTGIVALFRSNTSGGITIRRLLPAILLIPPVIGWFRLEGEIAGWFGMHEGVALFAFSNMVLVGALVWITAWQLHKLDLSRKEAEELIHTLNSKLEQRVLERTSQLEAANRELESFSFSVSHDLRAPLRAIAGFTQILHTNHADRLDEAGHNYLERVIAAANRMSELIDDLLNLSRVNRADFNSQKINLSAIAVNICEGLQQADPSRQTEFVIGKDAITLGDPRLLRIALENLLGNAWKFTSKKPQARIEFGTTDHPEKGPCFYVCDNGAGFEMEYASKLFGAFQRLHTAGEFPGTGIGLAIVQRIVNRHQGTLWAVAQKDLGATFYFTIGNIPATGQVNASAE